MFPYESVLSPLNLAPTGLLFIYLYIFGPPQAHSARPPAAKSESPVSRWYT